MTDLLDKLQHATEGSRELSDDVLAACGWEVSEGPANTRLYIPPDNSTAMHQVYAPDPTEDLQDAVSLIGDDAEDVKLVMKRGELSSAMIRLRGDAVPFWGKHHKLPLAVCEAIIKASSKAEAADPVVPIDAGDLRYW